MSYSITVDRVGLNGTMLTILEDVDSRASVTVKTFRISGTKKWMTIAKSGHAIVYERESSDARHQLTHYGAVGLIQREGVKP